jgi:hypothetical protein
MSEIRPFPRTRKLTLVGLPREEVGTTPFSLTDLGGALLARIDSNEQRLEQRLIDRIDSNE